MSIVNTKKSYDGDMSDVTKEPTGFPNRTDSVISFDELTRIFTIEPVDVSFDIYTKGNQYTITGTSQVTIDDIEGDYFIYFDELGELQFVAGFDPRVISDWVYTSVIHWDATNKKAIIFGEERHGLTMDGATHSYLHTVKGSQYISGFALDNILPGEAGDLDIHAQISVNNGQFRDEDILHNIIDDAPQNLSLPATIPVIYRDGVDGYWRMKTADSFPMIYSGTAGYVGASGRLPFNEFTGTTWQLTEIGNGKFVVMHILATNDTRWPIMAIQGQSEYITSSEAKDGVASELLNLAGLPFQEFVALGSIIFTSSNNMTNTPQAAVIATDDGQPYFDWREITSFAGGGVVQDHGSLSGLLDDDHPHYHTDARGDAKYSQLGHNHVVSEVLIGDYVGGGTPSIDVGTLGNGYIDSVGLIGNNGFGLVTQNGALTIDIAAGAINIRATDDVTLPLEYLGFAAVTNLDVSVFINGPALVYLDYTNGASIQVSATHPDPSEVRQDIILLAEVHLGATSINDIHDIRQFVGNHVQENTILHKNIFGTLVDGQISSETGVRNLVVEFGGFYRWGNNIQQQQTFDSSGTDTFVYWYRDGVGGWTTLTSETQLNNTQYDDGTGTLSNLNNNRYRKDWIFRSLSGQVNVLLGQVQHTLLSSAIDEPVPTLPDGLGESVHIYLLSTYIIQEGTSIGIFTDLANRFKGGGAGSTTDHGTLSGLSDDDHLQYHDDTRGDARYFTKATYQHAASEGQSSTTNTVFQQKLRMTTGTLPSGDYKISWNTVVTSTVGDTAEMQVQIDDTITINLSSTSETDASSMSGFYIATGVSGVLDIDIDYRAVSGTAYIEYARLEITRVN